MELTIKLKVLVPDNLSEREALSLILSDQEALNSLSKVRYHLLPGITAKMKIKPLK